MKMEARIKQWIECLIVGLCSTCPTYCIVSIVIEVVVSYLNIALRATLLFEDRITYEVLEDVVSDEDILNTSTTPHTI